MIKRILPVLVVLLYSYSVGAQERILTTGMKINKTTKIKKGVYKIDAPAAITASVIIIEGQNITVDFQNAILTGSNSAKTPDAFSGVAILVRNGKNITIKNLKAKGYKVVLMAKSVDKLSLENCDFSYNYRPRLNSTQEKEDISDWMSYHHNEKDEWLRYGAAIYLRNCNNATIRNCKVTGGQNALMMTQCNNGEIYNNDFSFNSGIGIGMYRCNNNRVMYNRINFNVRGYSHGVYNRGQDSAGILVYEQSNNNLFYKNSATHSGDGFFLWAGQTTMDSGTGGCNDNIIAENDFSYAPTNGVEITFSRNRVTGNRIFECDHGIWGGYSFNSRIDDNQFRNNRIAIAIEHGQYNEIFNNLFSKDGEAIRLWARKEQPADWGYAKHRDTRSVGYSIALNSFNHNTIALNLNRTDSIEIWDNSFSYVETRLKLDSTVSNIDSMEKELVDTGWYRPEIKDPIDPFKGNGKLAGRKNILITEWGPYDFRYPIIWNINPADKSDTIKFELLGPKGKWVIKNSRGIQGISASGGVFPASITAQKTNTDRVDIFIELEYTGEKIITAFGETIAANKPYRFFFKKFFQPLDWEVLFFSLDTVNYNPIRETGLFPPNVRVAPVKTEKVNKLDYAWWGGIRADQQYKQFITIATAEADIPPGNYELSVTWDDAVRIYMDNKLILDEWNPSKYTFDESPNRKIPLQITGKHQFRVEHLELGGFATLSLKLLKK